MPDLRPTDVFKPGGQPSITYVSRARLRLEKQLRRGLEMGHSFTVVSGPSKTGKSVLCKHVLAEKGFVLIDAGAIRTLDEFWTHVAYKLTLPSGATKGKSRTWTWTGLLEGGISLPKIFSAKTSGSGSRASLESLTANYTNVPVLAALKKLREKSLTLLIEDFHFLEREVQKGVLRSLKNAVAEGLPVVLLAVPHRAFDPVSVEGELAGRVEHVLLPSWSPEDLSEIPERGFDELKIDVASNIQRKICDDGFGNPLLVQDLCLRVAERLYHRPGEELSSDGLASVYDELVEGRGNQRFERLVHASGERDRPARVRLAGGGEDTLPAVIMAALARAGPAASTSYEDIRVGVETTTETCPSADEIYTALGDISAAAREAGTPPLEWIPDQGVLVITDPYLLFHLKWQIKDRRVMRLPTRAVDRLITGPTDPSHVEGEPDE